MLNLASLTALKLINMTESKQTVIFAKVVKNINDFKIVINKGSIDGVKIGQRFLIYSIEEEEIFDPETKISLGNLEIVKGTGVATHIQEKITTIQSDKEKSGGRSIIKRNFPSFAQFTGDVEEVIINPADTQPFDNIQIGDLVKPI